ncbi:MAG: hypothetical protein NTW28_35455, partial [Candidatus Solibacter sp.]|nr:hypothetical protein [Candidatus Solibacter sp.]
MPHEGVPHQIHVVVHAEIHEVIGGAKIIAVRTGTWVEERPFHLVLRDELIELGVDQRNVLPGLLRASAKTGAGRNGTVDGCANAEVVFESVLQR